jgi:hypothetical protein
VTVLAHAGHWLVQVLYGAPVLLLLVFIVVGQIKERKARKAEAEQQPPDDLGYPNSS